MQYRAPHQPPDHHRGPPSFKRVGSEVSEVMMHMHTKHHARVQWAQQGCCTHGLLDSTHHFLPNRSDYKTAPSTAPLQTAQT
jgi:hypothetical protein